MKKPIMMRLFLAALLTIAPVISRPAQAGTTNATAAAARQYIYYNVTITGSVYGRAFSRSGIIALASTITQATTNGVNPIEVALISGNPWTNPQIGAITFATNTALLGGTQQLDLCTVSYTQSTGRITVSPDSRISATGLNGFNALSGLTANFYQIFSGQMQLQLQNNAQRITGQVNLLGTGSLYYAQAPYIATISGQYAGSGVF